MQTAEGHGRCGTIGDCSERDVGLKSMNQAWSCIWMKAESLMGPLKLCRHLFLLCQSDTLVPDVSEVCKPPPPKRKPKQPKPIADAQGIGVVLCPMSHATAEHGHCILMRVTIETRMEDY